MPKSNHHKLLDEKLIEQEQFDYLDKIYTNKIISLFYELRTILYLGVLLFTTGVGLLIYENLGDAGHYIAIVAIFLICGACFWYVFKHQQDYDTEKVDSPTPYFDYVLLLGCLLFLSLQAYIQYLTNVFEGYWSYNSLFNAIVLYAIAYRYDHLGILSLAITAFASFWGISVSPKEWVEYNGYNYTGLYFTGVGLGLFLCALGVIAQLKDIKKHFSFTYMNFGALIFFLSCLSGMFDDYPNWFFLLILLAGSGATVYYANWKRSFLFLIYAFLASYIGVTYLMVILFEHSSGEAMFYLWFLYSIASCAGFIVFVIKFKDKYKEG